MGVRGDLQMLETAIRRRYPIDAEKAAHTVNQFLSDPDPRAALRAAAIAALMEGQNQKDEHHRAIIELQRIRDQLSALLDSTEARAIEDSSSGYQAGIEGRIEAEHA